MPTKAEMNKQIAQLKTDLADRDETIDALYVQIADLEARIAELENPEPPPPPPDPSFTPKRRADFESGFTGPTQIDKPGEQNTGKVVRITTGGGAGGSTCWVRCTAGPGSVEPSGGAINTNAHIAEVTMFNPPNGVGGYGPREPFANVGQVLRVGGAMKLRSQDPFMLSRHLGLHAGTEALIELNNRGTSTTLSLNSYSTGSGTGRTLFSSLPALPRDRWFEIELRIKLSAGTDGWVDYLIDGKQVGTRSPGKTILSNSLLYKTFDFGLPNQARINSAGDVAYGEVGVDNVWWGIE